MVYCLFTIPSQGLGWIHIEIFEQHGVGDMAGETVTRAYLSEALCEEVGLPRNECAEIVDTVLREISDTLTKGEAVKISSFGSFSVRQKGERIGRNPKTGEEAPILSRRVVVFRASNVLKSGVNSALRNVVEGQALDDGSSTEPEAS